MQIKLLWQTHSQVIYIHLMKISWAGKFYLSAINGLDDEDVR